MILKSRGEHRICLVNGIDIYIFPVLLANYILGTYSTVKASTVGINIYSVTAVVLQKELASFFGILLIPIMGIFSAYFYYSKDKMEGTSIHIRPTAVTEYILMPTAEALNVEYVPSI